MKLDISQDISKDLSRVLCAWHEVRHSPGPQPVPVGTEEGLLVFFSKAWASVSFPTRAQTRLNLCNHLWGSAGPRATLFSFNAALERVWAQFLPLLVVFIVEDDNDLVFLSRCCVLVLVLVLVHSIRKTASLQQPWARSLDGFTILTKICSGRDWFWEHFYLKGGVFFQSRFSKCKVQTSWDVKVNFEISQDTSGEIKEYSKIKDS